MPAIAVDWSGRNLGAGEFIWLAEVCDGRLIRLENGRGRVEVIDHLIAIGAPGTVIGLDFSFSFPAWWCAAQGWREPAEVWAAMAVQGEALLADCAPPFWGRPGRPNPLAPERRYRATELADAPGAKSTFQIGGAGAVGTGSVRGMPHLRTLAAAGYDIWPFGDGAGAGLGASTSRERSRVLEIYPRALTGRVNKRRWQSRHALLRARFGDQDPVLLERAAGSEDAFDAAVSALVMAAHQEELLALEPARDARTAIEGRAWVPQTGV